MPNPAVPSKIFKYYLELLDNTMETVCIKVEEGFLRDIEKTMKRHRYTTKAEFIREAVRQKMKDLEKEEIFENIKKAYGSSKKKTSHEEYERARKEAFEEIARQFK